MCPGDVRREPLDLTGPVAPTIAPALDPTQSRVCDCAARLHAPAYVDLVFTSRPSEGRVTVEAKDDEDEQDPLLGPPFVACVGTVEVRFAKRPAAACGGAGGSVVYPVRLELAQ
jgi:hypothetical protein